MQEQSPTESLRRKVLRNLEWRRILSIRQPGSDSRAIDWSFPSKMGNVPNGSKLFAFQCCSRDYRRWGSPPRPNGRGWKFFTDSCL